MPALRREEGFALPLTVFLVTLMTLMLAGIYVRVAADRVMAESTGDMVDALAIAQGGLQTYFASQDQIGEPADGDSTRINVTGGYADVVVHLVHQPTDPDSNRTYIVRSTGHVIRPTMGSTPQASRTVAQFALWQVGSMDVIAAFAAANRIRLPPGNISVKQGKALIDGSEGLACGSEPTTVGLRVSDNSDAPPDPPTRVYVGAPAYMNSEDDDDIADLTGVNWAATIGGGFEPDYTSLQNFDVAYPSQLITGNLSPPALTFGTGLLIVTGDLDVSNSSFTWNGIVLVGGKIEFGASSTFNVSGAVISGLRQQLQGAPPPQGELGRTGTDVTITYCSTAVSRSLEGITGIVPIASAWIDNWATY